MNYERYFLVILLIISTIITGNLALMAYFQRQNRISKFFSLLLLAITIYCLGYAFELNCNDLSQILFWNNFQYIGIVLIPPLWLILALLYNGLERWLTLRNLILLFFIPVLTLIIKYCNLYHLFYHHLVLNQRAPFPLFTPTFGPWYWINTIYQNILLLSGMLFFLLIGRQTNRLYRHQVMVLLTCFLFPWFGQLLYLGGYSPWGIDLTPFALTITSIIAFWGFNVFRLFDIVPIAWTKVFKSLHDGVLVLDEQNRIVESNPTANRMLKLENHSLGSKVTKVLGTIPQLCAQITNHTEQIIFQTKNDNHVQYIESKLYQIPDSFNRTIGYTLIFTDKSEQIRLFNKLQSLATIDSLTAVKNRRFFFEKCQQELKRLQSQALPVSFILIDVDRFKKINDTYGHQTGDVVLQQTAQKLMQEIAGKNILGRVGGEEFAVLLPESLTTQASIVAERLLGALLSTPVVVNDLHLWITASFGVSGSANSAAITLDLLFAQADIALYQSKANGRKMVTVFDPTQKKSVGPFT